MPGKPCRLFQCLWKCGVHGDLFFQFCLHNHTPIGIRDSAYTRICDPHEGDAFLHSSKLRCRKMLKWTCRDPKPSVICEIEEPARALVESLGGDFARKDCLITNEWRHRWRPGHGQRTRARPRGKVCPARQSGNIQEPFKGHIFPKWNQMIFVVGLCYLGLGIHDMKAVPYFPGTLRRTGLARCSGQKSAPSRGSFGGDTNGLGHRA